MANKLERAIATFGRVFPKELDDRYSATRRHGVCTASTSPRSLPHPGQLLTGLFGFTRSRLMSQIEISSIPTEEIVGQSGTKYTVLRTLQDRGQPWGSVYLATGDNKAKVVLKEIPQDWNARGEIYNLAAGCCHIRLPIDASPDRRILVFEYLDTHLLDLALEDIPLAHTKRILYHTLQGIAGLHARGISHNDIKANNILVQMTDHPAGAQVDKVLITDLEDAVRLEPGQVLEGAPLGNLMWRSPEAHAEGPIGLPSDLFAFGIVCIYAVTKNIIFADNNNDSTEDDRVGTVLFRQMSYFADEDGINGLLQYLGESNSMREVFEAIEEACCDVDKEPFENWQMPGLDDDFKDLIMRLTRLDPRRRITVQEGLAHKWFHDI